MPTVLSAVAALLAAGALAVSLAVSGPVGPTGPAGETGATGPEGPGGVNCWDLDEDGIPDYPAEDRNGDSVIDVRDCAGTQGPEGPPGPAPIVATATRIIFPVPSTCQNLITVSLTVPGNGTLVVSLTFRLFLEHTTGTTDQFNLYGGLCAGIVGGESVPADLPTSTYETTVGMQWSVQVFGGAVSISSGVEMGSGASAGDEVRDVIMVAVFYSS